MTLTAELQTFSTFIGQIGPIGFSCLSALHLADPARVSEPEMLTIVHVDALSTLKKYLDKLAAFDYASCVKPGRGLAALWHITDKGKAFLQKTIDLLRLPGASTGTSTTAPTADSPLIAAPLEEKNFFSAPSSSSDQIDQSVFDSDQIRIEEEEVSEFKKFLCKIYGFTGERAQTLIGNRDIYGTDICAWMYQVRQMERGGFKFRKSAEAYALACLLRPDAPPESAVRESMYTLDSHWAAFQKSKQTALENENE
jgi:hypothetical protein